ncbi:hypothetical protein EVAR_40377_1 [Eumeta japonica]|uniref:Uncharacterized protein n=1 Tax=Eumeta variegata TaxID=151549 RepID=A0A4C1XNE3_EUMVA|nr:hypothetical protein EVAR_40377_1 [Eumeta japonica]
MFNDDTDPLLKRGQKRPPPRAARTPYAAGRRAPRSVPPKTAIKPSERAPDPYKKKRMCRERGGKWLSTAPSCQRPDHSGIVKSRVANEKPQSV